MNGWRMLGAGCLVLGLGIWTTMGLDRPVAQAQEPEVARTIDDLRPFMDADGMVDAAALFAAHPEWAVGRVHAPSEVDPAVLKANGRRVLRADESLPEGCTQELIDPNDSEAPNSGGKLSDADGVGPTAVRSQSGLLDMVASGALGSRDGDLEVGSDFGEEAAVWARLAQELAVPPTDAKAAEAGKNTK